MIIVTFTSTINNDWKKVFSNYYLISSTVSTICVSELFWSEWETIDLTFSISWLYNVMP